MNEKSKLEGMNITERVKYITIMIFISFIVVYFIYVLLYFPIERVASFKEAIPVSLGLSIGLLVYYVLLQLKNIILRNVIIVTVLILGYVGLCMYNSHSTLSIIMSRACFFAPIRYIIPIGIKYLLSEKENI